MPNINWQTSALVASGDTTSTEIATMTLPQTAQTVIGVWSYHMAGPGMTTLENLSGIFRLSSEDRPGLLIELPIEVIALTGTGMAVYHPKVWALEIPKAASLRLKGMIELDLAQTLASKSRFGIGFVVA